ncbi:hypothetical protein DL89DRAFT_118278 [Linderina pennispora]|uniref:G-protein coupled receptors family 1 profile domain-containing protein n=1 Tax=Linderina pennispora TaxID=61395 RepID=A0A1Y1VWB9_9FUNG|nr:uncharacterized protein DL89DRAFT_118278 [Linderina pennispora]ORX65315.1 hypothetical protein DL89DRAFT_118278 [Linderina pennispora]
MHNEAGCRIVLTLSNMSSHLVVYLCAYMVIYLELVIIHNLSPHARRPRVILATICVLCSVGPQFVYLTIPRKTVGLESFCDLPLVVNDQLYHVIIGTVVVWALLAGIASFVSMSIVAVHIRRTSRRARRISNIMTHEGVPGIYSRKDVGRSTADLLNQTLKSAVWFPITPVASLWFNSALVFVRFYSQRPYYNLEYINISLFSLMTIFMAVAFFFNPMVMGFLRDYRRSWKASKCGDPQNNIQRSPIGLRIRVNSLFSSGTLADFVS